LPLAASSVHTGCLDPGRSAVFRVRCRDPPRKRGPGPTRLCVAGDEYTGSSCVPAGFRGGSGAARSTRRIRRGDRSRAAAVDRLRGDARARPRRRRRPEVLSTWGITAAAVFGGSRSRRSWFAVREQFVPGRHRLPPMSPRPPAIALAQAAWCRCRWCGAGPFGARRGRSRSQCVRACSFGQGRVDDVGRTCRSVAAPARRPAGNRRAEPCRSPGTAA